MESDIKVDHDKGNITVSWKWQTRLKNHILKHVWRFVITVRFYYTPTVKEHFMKDAIHAVLEVYHLGHHDLKS
jgi:hypothetical protein